MDTDKLIKNCSYGLYGYANEQGQQFIPCEFIDVGEFQEGLVWCVNKEGKAGYYDANGNIAISFKYDGASAFYNGLAYVGIDGKWGYVDKHGNEVIPLQYENDGSCDMGRFYKTSEHGIYASVKLNGKFGAIDQQGKCLVPFKYDGVSRTQIKDVWEVCDNYKYGLVEMGGKQLVPMIYDYIMSWGEKLFQVEKNNRFGIIDVHGKEILPVLYKSINSTYGAFVIIENEKYMYGAIDMNAVIVLPCDFSEIKSLRCLPNLILAKKKRHSWGVYTIEGEELLPCGYQEITNIIEESVHGIDIWSKHPYDSIPSLQLSLKQKNKYGLYDPQKQRFVVDCIYEDPVCFMGPYAIVKRDGRFGLLNREGREVIECKYDSLKSYQPISGMVTVVQDGKEEVLNIQS